MAAANDILRTGDIKNQEILKKLESLKSILQHVPAVYLANTSIAGRTGEHTLTRHLEENNDTWMQFGSLLLELDRLDLKCKSKSKEPVADILDEYKKLDANNVTAVLEAVSEIVINDNKPYALLNELLGFAEEIARQWCNACFNKIINEDRGSNDTDDDISCTCEHGDEAYIERFKKDHQMPESTKKPMNIQVDGPLHIKTSLPVSICCGNNVGHAHSASTSISANSILSSEVEVSQTEPLRQTCNDQTSKQCASCEASTSASQTARMYDGTVNRNQSPRSYQNTGNERQILLLHVSDLSDEVRMDIIAKIKEHAPNVVVHSIAGIEHLTHPDLREYFKIFCIITTKFREVTSGHIQHNQSDQDHLDNSARHIWSLLKNSLPNAEIEKKLVVALIPNGNQIPPPRMPDCFSDRLKTSYPDEWKELAEELEIVTDSSPPFSRPENPTIKFVEKSLFATLTKRFCNSITRRIRVMVNFIVTRR